SFAYGESSDCGVFDREGRSADRLFGDDAGATGRGESDDRRASRPTTNARAAQYQFIDACEGWEGERASGTGVFTDAGRRGCGTRSPADRGRGECVEGNLYVWDWHESGG